MKPAMPILKPHKGRKKVHFQYTIIHFILNTNTFSVRIKYLGLKINSE